jgi:uncharacterized YigZ family protein
MEVYKTISAPVQADFRELGSKFIAFLYPITDAQEFQLLLKQLKTELYDATHHCSAYRLATEPVTEKSSDDGEPGGTAGLPMLNALRSANLYQVGAIVVRYFGGTKLGTRGLIEAYGGAVEQAIAHSNIYEVVPQISWSVVLPFDQIGLLQQQIGKIGNLVITGNDFHQQGLMTHVEGNKESIETLKYALDRWIIHDQD